MIKCFFSNCQHIALTLLTVFKTLLVHKCQTEEDHLNVKILTALLLFNACTLLNMMEICVTNNNKLKLHPRGMANLQKRLVYQSPTMDEFMQIKVWVNFFFMPWTRKKVTTLLRVVMRQDFLRLLLCSLSLQSSILFSCLFLFLRPSVWLWRINRFRSVSWIWLRAFAPLTSPPSLSSCGPQVQYSDSLSN